MVELPTPDPRVALDPNLSRYAARVHGMRASEIRALFSVASRPEVVSLAGGMPFTAALPLDAVGTWWPTCCTTGGAGPAVRRGPGRPVLREQITEVMALEGITASPTTSWSPSAASRR